MLKLFTSLQIALEKGISTLTVGTWEATKVSLLGKICGNSSPCFKAGLDKLPIGCVLKTKLNTKEIYALPLINLPQRMKTTYFIKTSSQCKFSQKGTRQLFFIKLSIGYTCNNE